MNISYNCIFGNRYLTLAKYHDNFKLLFKADLVFWILIT